MKQQQSKYNERRLFFMPCLPYDCFPFLWWVKFYSSCFRQVFFVICETKKVVTGHVRQVVILYSNGLQEFAGADSVFVVLDEWLSYKGGCLNRFVYNSNMQNLMMECFIRFRFEIHFLGELGPKTHKCQFKLKFSIIV